MYIFCGVQKNFNVIVGQLAGCNFVGTIDTKSSVHLLIYLKYIKSTNLQLEQTLYSFFSFSNFCHLLVQVLWFSATNLKKKKKKTWMKCTYARLIGMIIHQKLIDKKFATMNNDLDKHRQPWFSTWQNKCIKYHRRVFPQIFSPPKFLSEVFFFSV